MRCHAAFFPHSLDSQFNMLARELERGEGGKRERASSCVTRIPCKKKSDKGKLKLKLRLIMLFVWRVEHTIQITDKRYDTHAQREGERDSYS